MATENYEIDRIAVELFFYANPTLFKDDQDNQLKKGKRYDHRKIEEYVEIVMNINWFLKKISKYELFFEHFYPDNKQISKHDALEHHIHAYLDDMETLRNRLDGYVGKLKNDLKKTAKDKKKIELEYMQLKNEIFKSFSNVSENRNPHRHQGGRFLDINLVHAESANVMLENDFIRKRLSEYGVKKMEEKRTESFSKAKAEWVDKATKNYAQVLGLTETIFKMTNGILYNILDIKPITLK